MQESCVYHSVAMKRPTFVTTTLASDLPAVQNKLILQICRGEPMWRCTEPAVGEPAAVTELCRSVGEPCRTIESVEVSPDEDEPMGSLEIVTTFFFGERL